MHIARRFWPSNIVDRILRSNGPCRQQTHVTALMNNSHAKHQKNARISDPSPFTCKISDLQLMTPPSNSQALIIGVDIGGTKVAVGLVDPSGKIVTQERRPMVATSGPEPALQAVTAAIASLAGESLAAPGGRIHGIGICAPGPLDPNTGVVINPPNLPCWRNFPLAAEISKSYRVPVKIENDANAAALAEVLWCAGKGYAKVFYISIGTGIGTGFILDGHIYN